MLPALLGSGAAEGEGKLRAFCACALFPAVAPLVLAHVGDAFGGSFAGRWEPSLLYKWPYFIVAMWALAGVFGLTAVLFHWLFQLAERGCGRANTNEEHGGSP